MYTFACMYCATTRSRVARLANQTRFSHEYCTVCVLHYTRHSSRRVSIKSLIRRSYQRFAINGLTRKKKCQKIKQLKKDQEFYDDNPKENPNIIIKFCRKNRICFWFAEYYLSLLQTARTLFTPFFFDSSGLVSGLFIFSLTRSLFTHLRLLYRSIQREGNISETSTQTIQEQSLIGGKRNKYSVLRKMCC